MCHHTNWDSDSLLGYTTVNPKLFQWSQEVHMDVLEGRKWLWSLALGKTWSHHFPDLQKTIHPLAVQALFPVVIMGGLVQKIFNLVSKSKLLIYKNVYLCVCIYF